MPKPRIIEMQKWPYLIIAFILLVFDQLIKNLAIKNALPEMGGYLANFCNYDMALSIPMNEIIFWILWIIIITFILYQLKKSFNFFLLLVLFGALSNALDRIIRGCVVDYINLPFFPAFNIADVMITIGVILFIFQTLLKENKSHSS